MQLFRDVNKAITSAAAAPQPKQRPRRTEETGRAAFHMAARKIMRRTARLPAEAYAAATACLWDTLNWLNQWHSDPLINHEPATEVDADVDASPSNYLSLHL